MFLDRGRIGVSVPNGVSWAKHLSQSLETTGSEQLTFLLNFFPPPLVGLLYLPAVIHISIYVRGTPLTRLYQLDLYLQAPYCT